MNPQFIPVLIIPHLNRQDLLERCICSIDFQVEHLVIIDNSNKGIAFIESQRIEYVFDKLVRRTTIITHPNAGVASSWNEAIKLFPATWWMLVNNDIQFFENDLAKMARTVECNSDAGCVYGNHGASFWIVTKLGVNRVGLFDENFYPAYLEDCDWSRRADLLRVRRVNAQDILTTHGDDAMTGSCTIYSDPALRLENQRTHGGNFEYYRAKWGGDNAKETFSNPFNDPHWPVDLWRFDSSRRNLQQWHVPSYENIDADAVLNCQQKTVAGVPMSVCGAGRTNYVRVTEDYRGRTDCQSGSRMTGTEEGRMNESAEGCSRHDTTKKTFIVLTPFSRAENLTALLEMWPNARRGMEEQVRWMLICHNVFPPIPEEGWIQRFSSRAPDSAWNCCYWKCNEGLHQLSSKDMMDREHYFGFLCDDDTYQDGFFKALANVADQGAEVIVVGAKRYGGSPSVGGAILSATPENMRACHVGLEQFFVRGDVMHALRFENHACADGRLVERLFTRHPAGFRYVTDTFVNYYVLPR